MHLTDVQLNEYLDDESAERAQIDAHLSLCAECAARLAALRSLFAEIESLPELPFSTTIAARFTPTPGLSPHYPRWLTLTAALQAAAALIALIAAAPFVANLLPEIEAPSFTGLFFQIQSQWVAWLDLLSTFQVPAFPQSPVFEISSLVLTLTLAGASVLWLVGNGLLLRNYIRR